MMRRTLAMMLLLLPVTGCGGGHHHKPAPQRHSHAGVAYTVKTVGGQRVLSPPNPAHPPGFGIYKGTPPAHLPLKSTPTVLMYDDVTVSRIPSGALAVACYAVGGFANCGSMRAAFPRAYLVTITPTWAGRGQCLDVEPFDATPPEAGLWVLADMKAGFPKPCVYASYSTMPQVDFYLARALGPQWASRVFRWDARWTFFPVLDSGFGATQWYGGNVIDKSQATLDFLHEGRAPTPPPPPPGPSPTQIKHWQTALVSSYHVWATRHCEARLTRTDCYLFGYERVLYYQAQLNRLPRYHQGHCFGPHRNLRQTVCNVERPYVSHWSKARDSTERVLRRRNCARNARGVCGVLAARDRRYKSLIHTYLY